VVDLSAITVFISYSHDSPEHSQRVLQMANALRAHGVDVELDQYQIRPLLGWPRWCEEQLRPENSAFVLVICTKTYRERVEGKTPADEGRGVFWEGGVIYNYLYNEKGNKRFIPVLLTGASEQDIPVPLQADTRYQPNTFELHDAAYEALYRELTGQPAVIKPPLGEKVTLPPHPLPALNVSSPLPTRQVLSAFIPVDISHIDKYAPAVLIGREDETNLLDEAWAKAQNNEPDRPRILIFVALGGEGKTSLVAKWAANLASRNWPGCEAAFAWSFYAQGTRDQATPSSDLFLKEALTFFGDPEMASSELGAYEKGRRLAQLVCAKRALLILDGLEPLQYQPDWHTPGEIKDQGLAALLKRLAANNQGFCVLTTRYSNADLRPYRHKSVQEVELRRLSPEAGEDLLKSLGVKGHTPRAGEAG
jgi:TIR domain/NACHT domain